MCAIGNEFDQEFQRMKRVVVGKQTIPKGKPKKPRRIKRFGNEECDEDNNTEESLSDQETKITNKDDLDVLEEQDEKNWIATAELDVYDEDFVEMDDLLENEDEAYGDSSVELFDSPEN